jgi:cytidylate kinase
MKESTHEEPGILAAAERQMHTWAMIHDRQDRPVGHQAEGPAARPALRFVSISREAGAGGTEIGQCVGRRLGWEVFDRNLLDRVAERFHLPRMMLDLVDETHTNWVYDVLGSWMDRELVPHEKYVVCLTRVLLAAARRGRAVFVGRGAQFLLPRPELLAVRIVASPKYRIRQFMEKRGLTEADARREIQETDEGRRQFVEKFFHHDVADPHLYDLVINAEHVGKAGAVEQILTAVGR